MVRRRDRLLLLVAAVVLASAPVAVRPARAAGRWRFAVSADSRNCGDVVMPAVARAVRRSGAAFFWHLGDLRNSFDPDEDIQSQPQYRASPLTLAEYHAIEWQDAIAHQIEPFGAVPFFPGIGNHETMLSKTREEFIATFAPWLDAHRLRSQRHRDTPGDSRVTAYSHWIDRGVAFYFLDNASNDQFDDVQLAWFERALAHDVADQSIAAVVVGMHKPLPDGYNPHNSMNESERGTWTGRRVYVDLLDAQHQAGKHVYVLAAHQHFYMPDAYGTPYWKEHGGVLPGWIVGTGGGVRSPLPDPSPPGALTNVYGWLLGTVLPDREIRFEFQKLDERDIPPPVRAEYGPAFVHWCFASNTNVPRLP